MGSPLLVRRSVAVALATTLLAALVAVVGAAASPAGAQEASPAPVSVTRADDGRTVRLVPGQELHVELAAPTGEQWQGPTTNGPLYLVEYTERSSGTTARLEALRPAAEAVVLRAQTDRACFHSNDPCPQAFSTWSLSVVVDEGPTPTAEYQCLSRPSASPAPWTILLTEGSSGSRLQVPVGKRFFVDLRSCTDHYAVPTAGSGPLWRESAGSRANGYAAGTFVGLRPGTARITSFTDPACLHTATPCARPSSAWFVDVEVVPAGSDDDCRVPTALALDRTTIRATGTATATVTGAAGVVVDLLAYSRPSTTYRVVRTGTTGADGTIAFALRPPTNTRLFAVRRGCDSSRELVLDVATALTLEVARTGTRTYRFAGDSLPARSGGLIVSLYRVQADGRQVLTAQARADAGTGAWSLERRFTGGGRFGFVVRTGQDLQNAPGSSNVRSLLVF